MNDRPRILITGAGGFTGGHACEYFHKNGYEVIGVFRRILPSIDISQSVECNLLDKVDVERLIEITTPDYILHLAAQNHVGMSWSDPVFTLETNVLSTLYLLESIRKFKPTCKMIVVGSTLQYDPQNILTLPHPYSLSKTLQVLVARAWEALYQLNIVIAKPSNLIGPGNSNGVCSVLAKRLVEIESHSSNKELEVFNLNSRRDFIDVRDAVRGYHYLFKHGKVGEAYEIASGQTLSIGDVIEYFKLYTSATFSVITKNDTQGDIYKGNPEEMFKLGWKPLISYDQSFEDILNFYRSRPNCYNGN